tara:strand:- start:311 stop:655 length:345 start_codon:yes stop_codon:yes gene_type:complete
MSMIKWQNEAVKALINDPSKNWGCEIDITNDTIKGLWGAAESLSMSDINTKAVQLKNASEYIDNRVGITSGYPLLSIQLDQLWHDIDDGKFGNTAKTGSWYVGISSIKTAFPKP